MTATLFTGPCDARLLAETLDRHHYLGAARRGFGWSDEHGCLVLAPPTSRRLPSDGTWLELVRWCLLPTKKNSGSLQWSSVRKWLLASMPNVTTVVSYSDPAAGHSGALYRACGWKWAPTWHRLRPPPTGNGRWADAQQAVKDRWVDALRPDARRCDLLAVNDSSVHRKMPWASWVEPKVAHGLCVRGTGGGDFKRWKQTA